MLLIEPICVTTIKGFRHGYFSHRSRQRIDANAAKPRRPNGRGFGLKKAMDIQADGALALLQALPLVTSGNLDTQVNTMA